MFLQKEICRWKNEIGIHNVPVLMFTFYSQNNKIYITFNFHPFSHSLSLFLSPSPSSSLSLGSLHLNFVSILCIWYYILLYKYAL